MLIIPAIDLKQGQCVRLKQGLMDQVTVFSDSPANRLVTGWRRVRAACTW
jgi:phosphoribosylformimino-5-aminoimidazole carboxamide ribotide isomerase